MSSSRKDILVDWEEPVAKGSTSCIFKGMPNGSKIAIKSVVPTQQDLFHNEKEVLTKLNLWHAPNTIRYLDRVKVSNVDYPYCLPLEWMPKSLFAAFTEEEVDWKERYQIMLQMLNGVAFYHRHSLLHQDIKSLNVLIDEQHSVKFCDFALAIELEFDVSYCGLGGSLPWVSPEYLKNKRVTYAADIYSLATTFWEIAEWNGAIPFLDKYPSKPEIQKAILAGERNDIPKSCPAPIAKLITWGWSEKPMDRPSADVLLKQFQDIYCEIF